MFNVSQEDYEPTINAFIPYTIDDPRFDLVARRLDVFDEPITHATKDGMMLRFESRIAFAHHVVRAMTIIDEAVREMR